MKSKFILPIAILFFLLNQVSILAQWRTIEAPYPIIQSYGTASEDKLFLPGGNAGGGYISTVAVYDINSSTWSEMPLSQPRAMVEATINGDLLFCAGGIQFENGAVESDAIEIYNTQTNEPLGLAQLSTPRVALSAVSVGTKVLFAGGANPFIDPNTFSLTDFEVFNTVDIYDIATDTWTTAELSEARAGMASAVLGDKAYFAGGYKGNGMVSDVVDIYDASTDTWTTETLSIPRAFYGRGGTFKGKVYFAGGTMADSKNTTQIDIYDPATDTWSTEQLTAPRSGVLIGTTEKHILFVGGSSESNLIEWQAEASSNIVDIYDSEIDDWDIYEMDVERMNHTVLSAQDQVFIIGGVDLSTFQVHSSIDVFRGTVLDYDGVVVDMNPQNTYTIATLNHLKEEFKLNYQIENTGKFALNSITFTFNVKKDGELIHTESSSFDLATSGDKQEIKFNYLPDEIGQYEFEVSASQPNISDRFYVDTNFFEISETTLAKEDGVVDEVISPAFVSPAHYGYLGTEFELLSPDVLSAVSVRIPPFPDFADSEAIFHIIVKGIDQEGNALEGELFKSRPIQAAEAMKEDFSFFTFELPEPLHLEAGNYIFATGQDSLGKLISYAVDTNPDPAYWEYSPVDTTAWINYTLPWTLMIRPHFSDATNTSPPAAEQWNKIANNIIPIGHKASSIKMVDENSIWLTTFGAFGPNDFEANILKSIDGGLSWEFVASPDLADHYASDISPLSEAVAFVSMLDAGGSTEDGVIADALFKTTDGGQTWEKVEGYPYTPIYIHFFNENEGWIMGQAEDFVDGRNAIMSITTDGGQTWSHAGGTEWAIPEGRSLPSQDPLEELGFTFDAWTASYDVVGNTIMIGSTKRIWVSSDKGQNWSSMESPLFVNDTLFTTVVAMKDDQTFMIASTFEAFDFLYDIPKAYATTDGGATWIESNPTVFPTDLAYLPGTDNTFLLTGYFQIGEELGIPGTERTNDLQNWEYVDDKRINTMAFVNQTGIGFFGNYPNLGTAGNVYSWGEAIIPAYEAAIARASQYKYTEIPINHLEEAVTLIYDIQSVGLNDLEDVSFHLNVLKDEVSVFTDSVLIAKIDTSATAEVSFTYLPDEIGRYEFVVTASQANIGNDFFQDVQSLHINETTISKDDGSPESGISINFISPNHYGYLGTEFKLLSPDQVRAVTMFLIPDTLSDFHVLIKEVDENGNAKEGELFKSPPISGAEATVPGFVYTYVLEQPLDLQAGNYIIAVGQDQPISGQLVFGVDTDRFDETFWVYNPVDAAVWTRDVNGTLMFRVHVGDFMTTNTEEVLAQSFPLKVFPVPFQEAVYIQLDYPVEPSARLQLFDATGRLWADRVVDHHQLIRQDVRQVPDGMYFLRISSGNYIKTIKVMKQ